MCNGISGTIDDKGVVRTRFDSSHDGKENKPDENRRTYWEWETRYPFKRAVFTNIGEEQPDGSELPEPDNELKRKVRKFIKDNWVKIALALLEQEERKGMELMSKSRNRWLNFQKSTNGKLDFWGSNNGELGFWKSRNKHLNFCDSKNGNLDFRESENGYLDFQGSKNGKLDLYGAKIAKGGDVRYLKTGWKKADKIIEKLSGDDEIPLGKMIEMALEEKACATE